MTQIGREVLQPVAPEELPEETPAESVASFASEEVEPAFVARGLVEEAARPTVRGPLRPPR